jgi:hypothetical protein
MNTNVTYKSTITVFKEWNEETREGVINTSVIETGVGFDLVIKYIKEDKILAFYNVEDYSKDPLNTERVTYKKLMSKLLKGQEVEAKPHIPPAVQKLRELVKNDPCPIINLTPLEKDVLCFGIYSNPAHEVTEPWLKAAETIKIPSKTISGSVKSTKKASVGTVMASLTKKGLIVCTGKEINRICEVTRIGALVLRREILGA